MLMLYWTLQLCERGQKRTNSSGTSGSIFAREPRNYLGISRCDHVMKYQRRLNAFMRNRNLSDDVASRATTTQWPPTVQKPYSCTRLRPSQQQLLARCYFGSHELMAAAVVSYAGPLPASGVLIIFDEVWTMWPSCRLIANAREALSCDFERRLAFPPHVQKKKKKNKKARGRRTRPLARPAARYQSLVCVGCAPRLILTRSTKVTVVWIMIRFGFSEGSCSVSGESCASVGPAATTRAHAPLLQPKKKTMFVGWTLLLFCCRCFVASQCGWAINSGCLDLLHRLQKWASLAIFSVLQQVYSFFIFL